MSERLPIGEITHENGTIIHRDIFYAGHIPREELPKEAHVLYSRSPYTGELETKVTVEGIKPAISLEVKDLTESDDMV